MEIRAFDSSTFDQLHERVTEMLGQLGAELGLVLRVRRASYTQANAELVVEAATLSEQGVLMDREADAFRRLAREFGLEPTDLGREFGCSHKRMRVVGLRPRAKHPILCEQVVPPTGQRYRMLASVVRDELASAAQPKPALAPALPRPASDAAVQGAVFELLRQRSGHDRGSR